MTDTPTTTDADPGQHDHGTAWRRAIRRAGLVYLFSRLCTVLGAAIVAAEIRHDEDTRLQDFPWARWGDPHYAGREVPISMVRLVRDVFTSWDGAWYMRIARSGYPHHIAANVTYDMPDARAAFFPVFPGIVRVLDHVLPGGPAVAALALNFLLGALAVLLVGVLARDIFGVATGERAMVLMALFPGSFVLSFAYTEAVLIVLAALTLLLLQRSQWVAAGVVAAVATATRPNGIAVCVACAVAAGLAIHRRREWRALVAPILSPLGFLGFQWWLGHHTGERGVWFRVQTEAWGEGTSFGFTAVRRTAQAIINPVSSPTNSITAVCVAALVFMFWLARTHRIPAPMVAYSAMITVLMVIPETVTARPRFVYTAFPLLICVAAWFELRKREWWHWTIVTCAVGLTTLTALYGVNGAIP
ncbi:MAG TPA: glycosyltransferase family 39 protein [Ilumatobacteraceae bacterium]|nr:glycosyltransferase family 39 protein [Ilumatobacteraceae bacterium]